MILKTTLLIAFAGLVAGQRDYDNMGMHCKGEGITDLMQWDHAQCSAYCDVRDDCVGYVFNVKDNFTCILKGKTCEMAPSDVWRFYQKPGSSPRAGGNSDWNADPAESASAPSVDGGASYGGGSEFGEDVVSGPPGNAGNSFTKRDFHCAGKNIGNGEPWSLSECASACLRNDKCIGFIRLITGDQQCILKEAGCTKKPPTVWVFYEKVDNGEVLPEGAFEVSSTVGEPAAAALPPVSADAAPRIDENFADTQQHCKGGVISNEMRGHDQCARACLDAQDCIGYSIGTKEPYQCYLKSKECELSGNHPLWTFVKKNDQLSPSAPSVFPPVSPSSSSFSSSSARVDLGISPSISPEDLFREMRAVRCIKFAEEYGASSAEQCKQMCLERETFCVGVSFRSGSCKLITSFDCGGWQIFKKLAEDQGNGGGAISISSSNQGAWQPVGGEAASSASSVIDLSHHQEAPADTPLGDISLNDPMVNEDMLLYFYRLNGNCRGGRYLDDVWGTEAECAGKCHLDQRCRGFSYIKAEQRCTLKADACSSPTAVKSGVSFYLHLQRQ